MKDRNRIRGCLLGGAIGDALGYPVEFLSRAAICSRFGADGIRDYALRDGVAQISDDTQMTLFTANGLLFGKTRAMTRGISAPCQDYIFCSYQDWLKTQRSTYPADRDGRCSWLLNLPELYSRRAPGNTCLSAIGGGRPGSTGHAVNDSKGCGGVMRVAPVGAYFEPDAGFGRTEIVLLGAEAAALTHGHPLGYIPAAGLSFLINSVLYDGDDDLARIVERSTDSTNRIFRTKPHIDEYTRLLHRAVALAGADCSDAEAIAGLGEGWVAEETLAIAVFCALRHRDSFANAVVAAVNHDGDSDSTGAVCGNILGAWLGEDRLPEKYLHDLELRDTITEIADDLTDDCPISEWNCNDPVWEHKYIFCDYPNVRGDRT